MFDDTTRGEMPARVDTAGGSAKTRRVTRRREVIKATRVARYADLGPMPTDDPLAMNAWLHRALGVSASQVVHDPNLTDGQRRAELCAIATRMAALTDQSRIWSAERVVLGGSAAQNVRTGSDGPQLEPNDDGEAVSEASSGATPRRGRPRKRSLS